MKKALKSLDNFEKSAFMVIGLSGVAMLANYFINLF